MRNLCLRELSRFVRTREELLADGHAVRDLAPAGTEGPLRRVRRNRYVPVELWAELWPESRHRIEVLAATEEMRGGAGVVSHASAAVLWELPLFRYQPSEVEFTVHGSLRAATKPGTRRHLDGLDASDIVVRDGIRCTSLERTVFDLARTRRPEVAIACLDAALRTVSVDGHLWDVGAQSEWKDRMTARARANAGSRGIRQARRLIELADGRAQLPGESVSRLHLVRMGFARIELQVPVRAPMGGTYYVDFGLPEAEAWGEFDGKGKYLDMAMRNGRTIDQVVLDEKRREDWIRGQSQWRFARWGDDHIGTTEDLRARLAEFSIRPPR